MRIGARRTVVPWSYPSIQDVPGGMWGVYAFWCRDTGKCVYVGQAAEQQIRERLRDHWRGSHNRMLSLWIRAFGQHLSVCYAPVQKSRIDKLEQRLIRLWMPEANIRHKR